MSDTDLAEVLATSFVFKQRPRAVEADMRLSWRVPLVVLLLDKCHGRRATIRQLHVLEWSARTVGGQEAFLALLDGDLDPEGVVVRYDPTMHSVVALAEGFGLLRRDRGYAVKLLRAGSAMAQELVEADLYSAQRAFLNRIPGKVSSKLVEEMLRARSK